MDLKERILEHLNGDYTPGYERYISTELKKENSSQLKTLCCFHEETEGSLSINRKTGKFNCFGCKASGDFFKFYALKHGLNVKSDFPKILKGIANDFGIENNLQPKKRKIIATYDYTDNNGNLLYQKVRYNPKGFAQRRPDGNGGWIYNLKNMETVSYNLPQVINASEVCIPEGEKDCDILNKLGLVATTNPGGAGNWPDHFSQYFKGKNIIIFSDNDEEGKSHAQKVVRSLNSIATSMKIIEPPGLKEKQDVSDFIEGFADKEQAAEQLSILIENAQPYQPQDSIDEIKIKNKAQEILNAQQPCETYGLSNLPLILKDCCQEICESTKAEPIMVVQSLLVTISALIKKKVWITEGEYFQDLYPIIWAISIADSGAFKSTGTQKGARLAYEREKDIQEQIESIDRDNKEQINQARQKSALLPNRATAEALLEHLAKDHGGMIICTEIGEWLENLEKTHNKGFKALITDLFDSPPYYGYSTKGGGYLVIQKPFISINGVSTLTWVQNNVNPGDVNSGFFARFLIFYPPEKSIIPPALPGQIAKRNYKPLDRVRQTISEMPEKIDFKLSQEGRQYFEAVHAELYKTVRKENKNTQRILNPYLKRWSPYILKLAMLMQLFIDPNTDRIGVSSIEAAKSIVDYAIKSTTYLFQNQLGETEHQAKERKVIEYIANQKGKVKRWQLQSSHILDGGEI